MPRLLVLGDSLVLHRPAEGIEFKDTYAGKLKKALEGWEVHIRARRFNDTDEMVDNDSLTYDISVVEPDLAVIHVGIVDCALRLFSKTQRQFLQTLPSSLRQLIINYYSSRRKRMIRRRPKVYVPLKRFERNLSIIRDAVLECGGELVFITIAKPNVRNMERNPGLLENVVMYNEAIKRCAQQRPEKCRIIDFFAMVEKDPGLLLSDGVHPSLRGHQELFLAVKELIRIS